MDDDEAADADPKIAAMRREAIQALSSLGFNKTMRSTPVHVLSGGWRTRLAIAEAVLHRPDILVRTLG